MVKVWGKHAKHPIHFTFQGRFTLILNIFRQKNFSIAIKQSFFAIFSEICFHSDPKLFFNHYVNCIIHSLTLLLLFPKIVFSFRPHHASKLRHLKAHRPSSFYNDFTQYRELSWLLGFSSLHTLPFLQTHKSLL